MELSEAIQIFEEAITHFDLKPDDIRCQNEGEYLISADDLEIYIDLWQPESKPQWQYFDSDEPAPIFQIVVPICQYPSDEKLTIFLEELSFLNFHLHFASFITNPEEKMVSLHYRRVVEGLNTVEVIEPIEATAFYAKNLVIYLTEKYGTKKIK